MRDLRLTVRGLARRPVFTLVVIVTLALGIGATTAIFTILQAVILRPLPYREPDRLVHIWENYPKGTRYQWGKRLTGAGLIVGVALGVVVARAVSALVFGISPFDPLTFAGVPLLVAGVAILACAVPARRATKVDPIVALRAE